jgi:hypothetical protein
MSIRTNNWALPATDNLPLTILKKKSNQTKKWLILGLQKTPDKLTLLRTDNLPLPIR